MTKNIKDSREKPNSVHSIILEIYLQQNKKETWRFFEVYSGGEDSDFEIDENILILYKDESIPCDLEFQKIALQARFRTLVLTWNIKILRIIK